MRSNPQTRPAPDLADRVAALEARMAALEALGRRREPRDDADVAALFDVARALDGAAVTAAQLWQRARADVALREALRAADIDSARELGYWLRRLRGVRVGGLQLVSGAQRTGAGRRWAVRADADHEHGERDW